MRKFVLILLLLAFHFGSAQSLSAEKKSIETQINGASKHFAAGEYELALGLSKKALVGAFKIEDDYLIAHAYNSIGVVYDEFSESKRAIEYYNKALSHANNVENDQLKNWIYGNLGSSYYFSNHDALKGIDYYKKSLIFALKIKDSSQIAYTKLNIASAFFSIQDFKSGIKYVNDVTDYVNSGAEQEAKFTLNNLLGIYNSNMGQVQLAESYFQKSIAIGEANNMESFVANAYENLTEHYTKYDQPLEAKKYQDKFNTLSKKLYSEERRNILEKSAVQIELEEYRSQFERIELENTIHQQKLRESKLISIFSLTVCLILIVLLITLYRNNNFRKKSNIELLQANSHLKAAIKKAEEASQLKTQFVSTITHELRTPLYGVVGITNTICDEYKELADSPHLNSLKFSAKYLLSLVNDLLQMNKIEEKRIVLEKEPFNLHEEMNTVINSVKYIAANNHNEIVFEVDKNIPKILLGDKLRLSQIIMNLTSNALKFTKNGTVIVNANQVQVADNIHYVEFKVSDNGVGIAAGDQDKIFDTFVQVGRKDDDYQGTGLGLAIVKRLIELFGSSIALESKPNEGTTFTFTIGFEPKILKEEDVLNDIEVIFTIRENLQILVVEDNKINQIVTKKIMDKNHVKCDMVADGYAALELLESNEYDIILMDINMPSINGFETSRRIRRMGINTPIIALTAFDKEEITAEAMEAGINDIIIKPFEPVALFQMIQNQILRSGKPS